MTENAVGMDGPTTMNTAPSSVSKLSCSTLGGSWVVGDPKSEAGIRDVAIPPNIVPALKQHLAKHVAPQNDALLFPAKSGGHLQPSTLYRHFYKNRDEAKRPDLRFHDLRHSGSVLAGV
jgi:integrase